LQSKRKEKAARPAPPPGPRKCNRRDQQGVGLCSLKVAKDAWKRQQYAKIVKKHPNFKKLCETELKNGETVMIPYMNVTGGLKDKHFPEIPLLQQTMMNQHVCHGNCSATQGKQDNNYFAGMDVRNAFTSGITLLSKMMVGLQSGGCGTVPGRGCPWCRMRYDPSKCKDKAYENYIGKCVRPLPHFPRGSRGDLDNYRDPAKCEFEGTCKLRKVSETSPRLRESWGGDKKGPGGGIITRRRRASLTGAAGLVTSGGDKVVSNIYRYRANTTLARPAVSVVQV
jgi:hypothetical protein